MTIGATNFEYPEYMLGHADPEIDRLKMQADFYARDEAPLDRCGRAHVDMGLSLHRLFLNAGFESPDLLLTARVESGSTTPVYKYLAELIGSLVPAILNLGSATESESDIATLADRLQTECLMRDGVIVPSMMVGGFARLASRSD